MTLLNLHSLKDTYPTKPPMQPTLEQLTDNNLVTDDELKIILELHPKMQLCRKQALDKISQSMPTVVPILLGIYIKSEDSVIDLIQKKQSWGAYVRRGRDAAIAGAGELQVIAIIGAGSGGCYLVAILGVAGFKRRIRDIDDAKLLDIRERGGSMSKARRAALPRSPARRAPSTG